MLALEQFIGTRPYCLYAFKLILNNQQFYINCLLKLIKRQIFSLHSYNLLTIRRCQPFYLWIQLSSLNVTFCYLHIQGNFHATHLCGYLYLSSLVPKWYKLGQPPNKVRPHHFGIYHMVQPENCFFVDEVEYRLIKSNPR